MKILKYPDPFLRNKAVDVTIEEIRSIKTKNFLTEMSHTMVQHNGLGLAAVQLGDPRNVFVYLATKKGDIKSLFNAKIITRSGKRKMLREGCLSIPNFKYDIRRSKMVVIIALDSNGLRYPARRQYFPSTGFQ